MIDLDAYCVGCNSDRHTEERDGMRWCSVCWDWQRPLGSGLREELEFLRRIVATAMESEDPRAALEGVLEATRPPARLRELVGRVGGSDWWYDGRDIFHREDGLNLDQIAIPLPETWHESQEVPGDFAELVVEAVNFARRTAGAR